MNNENESMPEWEYSLELRDEMEEFDAANEEAAMDYLLNYQEMGEF